MPDNNLFPKKGQGMPVADAPGRQIVKKPAVVIDEEPEFKSKKYVNLGFKVPAEFRHKVRFLAGYQDTSMVEVLREAIAMYQSHYRIKVPNAEGRTDE